MSAAPAAGQLYVSAGSPAIPAGLSGFPFRLSGDPGARRRVILLHGDHDAPLPGEIGGACLICLGVARWNAALSPWPAPPLRGGEAFTGGGPGTLAFLTQSLLPQLDEALGPGAEYLLAGYSLAGLFALWACYICDRFAGVAAVSPSLWFPGWTEFAAQRRPLTRAVYLSLGDREEKTRDMLLSTVGDAVRIQYRFLQRDAVPSVLEWNPGNHFRDSDKRTARGIDWLLRQKV